MKKISFPYGKEKIEYSFDENQLVGVLESSINEYTPSKNQSDLVKDAIENPVGKRLCDLAQGKKNIVIIASDHTRPVPSKIIMPLIKSPLSTVAIISFQSAWNSVEASTFYINDDTIKNFAFYVSTLSNQSGNVVAGAGVSAAASLIMFVPSLVLFIILQSRVMNSMVHSGIK
jgi:hypothetical protein